MLKSCPSCHMLEAFGLAVLEIGCQRLCSNLSIVPQLYGCCRVLFSNLLPSGPALFHSFMYDFLCAELTLSKTLSVKIPS